MMDRRIIWTVLTLAFLPRMGAAQAQPPPPEPDVTATLNRLFDEDPQKALAAAPRMFEEREVRGDLDGVIAIVEVIRARAAGMYWPAEEAMLARAIAATRAAGRWGDVGDLYFLRARLTRDLMYSGAYAAPLRAVRFAELAEEAYMKAGRRRPEAAELAQQLAEICATWKKSERAVATDRELGPRWCTELNAIELALAEGDDADALAKLRRLLGAITTEPSAGSRAWVVARCGQMLWVPGAETLLPELLQAAVALAWQGQYVALAGLTAGCVCAWDGEPGVRYDAFRSALAHWSPREGPLPSLGPMVEKLAWLRDYGEADELARSYLQHCAYGGDIANRLTAVHLIHSRTPPDLRQRLLRESLLAAVAMGSIGSEGEEKSLFTLGFLAENWWLALGQAPPEEEQIWAREIGSAVLEAALLHPDPDSRAFGIEDAGRLFAKAGREDLVLQTRDLAQRLAQGDPQLLLRCATNRAQAAGESGDWSGAAQAVAGALGGAAPSEVVFEATALLARAEWEQGHLSEAAQRTRAAAAVLPQLKLTAAERAGRLMSLAAHAGDQATRAEVLTQAQRAAAEAGLGLLEDQAATQLAQAALDEGNLPAARATLLEICNRQENKREQLAFDPLLRQQWFADNLGPYRQLLRVAALQEDVSLALSCGERMRSRALADQLAWQKVDLGVGLPADLQARLENLRTMRTATYALLQRVTGSGAGGDGVRGEYMPIRGLLPDDQPITAADAPRLKELLGKLATEESALESAMREAVPAYGAAAATTIPTSEEMLAAIRREAGLAVVQYTFSDQGLVGVALGQTATKVAVIPQTADQLWERVGKFRQAIWEQKPEALTQAAELYATLVAPVEEVLRDAKSVWVVADGSLQLLPFGALRDAQGKYLAERLAVASGPSLSLALSNRGTRPAPDRVALVVAAPDTGAQQSLNDLRGMYMPIRGMYMPVRGEYMPIRGEGGVSDALTAMAQIPLPGAQAEGEAIAQWLQGTLLLTGKDAGKERVRQEAGNAGILHLATHGYADPDFPDFSGVLLAGAGDSPYSVLTAQEVYGMQLRARLVVLSACQTALGKDVAGEGLLGLTRAFLYAGAQDVMCSLWPVSDESTKVLMEYFYQGLAAGKSPEESLRQAQAALLHQEATSAPFYWAGFVLMHGPR